MKPILDFSLVGESSDKPLIFIVCYLQIPKKARIFGLKFLMFNQLGLFLVGIVEIMNFFCLHFPLKSFYMSYSLSVLSGKPCYDLFVLFDLFGQGNYAGYFIEFSLLKGDFTLELFFVFQQGNVLFLFPQGLVLFLVAWLSI